MKLELIKHLREAASHADQAAKQLDRSELPCDHCGTKRRVNWDEYQMATELDAMVRKLRNFANKLSTVKQVLPGGKPHA